MDSGCNGLVSAQLLFLPAIGQGIEAHTRHGATAKEPNKRSPGNGAESSSGVHFEYVMYERD